MALNALPGRVPVDTHQAGLFVLGAAQIGGLYSAVDEATAHDTLQAAWDLGVRRFDTAPHYGAGLSERRLGAFLQNLPRDSFILSTKVGRLLVDTDEDTEGVASFYGGDRKRRVFDYSADGGRTWQALPGADAAVNGAFLPPWDLGVRVGVLAQGPATSTVAFDKFSLMNQP